MKNLTMALLCCACASAFATEKTMEKSSATKMSDSKMAEAKPGEAKAAIWVPRKVTHEDKKGIDSLFASMESAMMKGDAEASAALVDYPVYMVTDNSKGDAMTATWDKKKYVDEMGASMQNMPKDMKVKHERKYDFLTDNMAVVTEKNTATMGKKTETWKAASLVVKKDGKWMVKSMMEGGWGDMPGMKSAEGTGGAAGPQ
jgi:hypothetical protein